MSGVHAGLMKRMRPAGIPAPAVAAVAVAALLLACALPASAVSVVDTGTPDGNAAGAYAFDATDHYAARIDFAGAASIVFAATHVLGGTAGETFTVALYDDGASTHLPQTLLHAATATYTADGWNGVSGLAGWNVAAGSYWIAFEIDAVGAMDTLGSGSVTGALLDAGVPNPLPRTAFDSGGGYAASGAPLGFGVRIGADVPAVPEPATALLALAGLAAYRRAGRA